MKNQVENQDIKRYLYKLKDFIKFALETIKWADNEGKRYYRAKENRRGKLNNQKGPRKG